MTPEETRSLELRVQDNPASTLFARLAHHYCELGRLDEAIDLCRRGLEHHPGYATAYIILAKAYRKKGELEAAEAALNKALELEPHNPVALGLLAQLFRAHRAFSKAREQYETILRLDPLDEVARLELESLRSLEEETAPPVDQRSVPPPPETTPSFVPQPEEEVRELAEEEVEEVIDEIFETGVPSGQSFEPEVELEEWEEAPPQPFEETSSPEDELREIFGLEEEEEKTVAPPAPEPPPAPTPQATQEPTPSAPGTPPRRSTLVTPTLGEIYAAQGQYAKAIGVFQVLKERDPDNPEWDRKIEMLKRKMLEAGGSED
ncbi:MAG: tetratricopeptide repeat protein [candidate division KSB1 bacterium]|nr:tetratricopeptide repeat protein [candidate division KSB1 bacterium]